jgi:Putative zinc ribbon domain
MNQAVQAQTSCQSCGMPMASVEDHAPGNPHSLHCKYCSKPDGALQDFEERFERMVQWQMRKGSDRTSAEQSTREHMKKMPVWKDHPKIAGKAGS